MLPDRSYVKLRGISRCTLARKIDGSGLAGYSFGATKPRPHFLSLQTFGKFTQAYKTCAAGCSLV